MKNQKTDLIKWVRSKGGINKRCPSADTKALSLKERRYIGLISKNGRYLDELRDEAEWERIVLPGTTTDDLNDMLINRVNGTGKHINIEDEKQIEKQIKQHYIESEIENKVTALEHWLYNIRRLKNEKA